ncbi:MAG: TIGR00730 family Rossman fold protein, partial [Caldilineae bacterium]
MTELSRVCVYCGASNGVNGEYVEAAAALGAELARRRLGLVYGGGSLGMMGALARSVVAHGGQVHGVIPGPLAPKEISGQPIGELEVVDSMHARKARMAELADAFIALPGGFGTLEELFETITWVQLGIHRKPIGLLNVAGFFEPLRSLIQHHIEQGFIRPTYGNLLVVAEQPAA